MSQLVIKTLHDQDRGHRCNRVELRRPPLRHLSQGTPRLRERNIRGELLKIRQEKWADTLIPFMGKQLEVMAENASLFEPFRAVFTHVYLVGTHGLYFGPKHCLLSKGNPRDGGLDPTSTTTRSPTSTRT